MTDYFAMHTYVHTYTHTRLHMYIFAHYICFRKLRAQIEETICGEKYVCLHVCTHAAIEVYLNANFVLWLSSNSLNVVKSQNRRRPHQASRMNGSGCGKLERSVTRVTHAKRSCSMRCHAVLCWLRRGGG